MASGFSSFEEMMTSMDPEVLMTELSPLMEEEMKKGSQSSVPKDYLAATSLLKDQKTGGYTREKLAEDLSNEMNEISQRKADLAQRIASGGQLTGSQALSFGILALGLMAAGGAIRGKKGLADAGKAFQVGGSIALDRMGKRAEAQKLADSQELSSLTKRESELRKEDLKNKLAPVEQEEKIAGKVEERRRKVKEGLVDPKGGSVTVNMPGALVEGELPSSVQQEIMKMDGAVAIGEKVAGFLSKLPDTVQGTIENQISKNFSATERGQAEAQLNLYKRILQSAIEGKRGSDQDNAIFSQIVSGDFSASGPVQANLIRQANEALKRIQLGQIETYQQLGTPEGVEAYKQKLRTSSPGGVTKIYLVDGKPQAITREEFEQYKKQGRIAKYGS